MLKYYDYAVVFQEVPDEISLAIEIVNCPHKCIDCHSPWLRGNDGTALNEEEIIRLIRKFPYISCICLMGGDSDHDEVRRIAEFIHLNSDKKVAMYSGDDSLDDSLIPVLDYYKIGSYQKDLGPLSSKKTNQRFYKIDNGKLVDITYRFINKIIQFNWILTSLSESIIIHVLRIGPKPDCSKEDQRT